MKITSSILVVDLPPELKSALDVENATRRAAGKPGIAPYLTKKGYAVRTGEVYACDMHRRDAERAAARGPSYTILAFDYGPGAALKPQVGA